MTREELIMLQSLPLEVKIAKSQQRIREWIDYYGENNVYVSFSGGKDSTVLLHLVRSVNPNILAVFCDTGLEYPEIKKFVKSQEFCLTIKPKLSFKQVIEKYGYPVISKEQSHYIYLVNHSKSEVIRNKHLLGVNRDGSPCKFTIAKKWRFALKAPFEISDLCCDVMKKRPFKAYEKKNNMHPFIGTLAEESTLRNQNYLKNGCNSFYTSRPTSTPLGFWTQQDILEYIEKFDLPLAECYGKVVKENGKYKTTGIERSGCIYCLYGIHHDKYPNRFQQLEETHPKLHDYCLNKLGFKEVCKFMNIPFELKDKY